MQYAREQGWKVDRCDRYNHYTQRTSDLFGCFDLIVLDDLWGCIGVQVTGGQGGNIAARIHRLEDSPNCQHWLARGNRAEVWGWRKLAAYRKDGSRAKVDRWVMRTIRIQAAHPIAAAFGSDQGVIVPLVESGR